MAKPTAWLGVANTNKSRHRYNTTPLRFAIRLLSHLVIALSLLQAWLIRKDK